MIIFNGSKEKKDDILKNGKNLRKRSVFAKIGVGLTMITFGVIGYDVQSNRKIATATDLESDEYNMAMPINTEDGIKLVPADSLVIINEPGLAWPNPSQEISVSAISEDGEYITGEVKNKYLKKVAKISVKDLEKYNEIVTVSGENVQFKVDPNLGEVEGNILSNIPENTQVLKSEEKEINDEANWYQILYIDDEGNMNEVYGRQQDLMGNVLITDKEQNSNNIDIQQDKNLHQNEIVKEISNIKMIVNTDEDEINLRSENAIDENNIILQIQNGAIVYALSDEIEENEYINWRKIRYVNPETDEEVVGWVSNELLKEYDLISKTVNTDSVGGITLKLRETPGGDVIDEIKNGTKINVEFENIIDMKIEGHDRYIYVTLDNGKSGYVVYDYLEDDKNSIVSKIPTEESKDMALSNYNISKNGDVIGIDISEGITAEQLEEMLKSNTMIPTQLTSEHHDGTVDTSEISGKINYVYIKIGASGYGEEGRIIRQDNPNTYRQQARICEKYGVPYGFYYYSTCISEDEAKREAGYINEAINLLDDREYNVLPFAIDYEWHQDATTGQFDDRQCDAGDLTESKALLSKLVSEKYGNVILYTSGFLISDNSSDKQVDWNRYNQIVGEKNIGLWLPTMISDKVGEYFSISKSDRDYFMPIMKSSGKSYFEQIILDTNINESEGALIDINLIDEETYKGLIEGQYLEMTGQKDIQKQDFER